MPQNAASDLGQHCLPKRISFQNTVKVNSPGTPKSRNGLIQMLRMDKSIEQNRV